MQQQQCKCTLVGLQSSCSSLCYSSFANAFLQVPRQAPQPVHGKQQSKGSPAICGTAGVGDPTDRELGVAYATPDDVNFPPSAVNAGPEFLCSLQCLVPGLLPECAAAVLATFLG